MNPYLIAAIVYVVGGLATMLVAWWATAKEDVTLKELAIIFALWWVCWLVIGWSAIRGKL